METLTKAELRKKILKARNSMPIEERKRADFVITEKVLGHNWFLTAENILVYMNTGSEVATEMIVEEAFRQKKRVYAPRVNKETMDFFQISSLSQLENGFKGIREPAYGLPEFVYEEQKSRNTLILMPGVVFDKSRNRIGYGKGYYDRYLQGKTTLHKMALSYECQIVEHIEAQEHDCRPDVILTQAQKQGGFQVWI